MGVLRPLATLGLLAALVAAQLPFTTIPTISDAVKEHAFNGRAAELLRIWEYALRTDGQGPSPVIRVNFEAKTLLAPRLQAMIELVPQDASNPLYGTTPALATLRREFLLDHLVLEPLKPTDPRLDKKSGVRLLTMSGKGVTFTKDEQGQMFVNGVPAESDGSLQDGTQIYILKEILFDNSRKVSVAHLREANILEELNQPTGPPLDIPDLDFLPAGPVIRSPAPPPPGVVGPPAIPVARPPAPPPSAFRASVRAPAPPPAFSDVIIFPSRQGQERARRQLQFPGLKGLGDLDPVLRSGGGGGRGRGGDLTLPRGFKLDTTPDNCFSGSKDPPVNVPDSSPWNNARLDPLTSIDRFATVFQLTNSPGDSIVTILQQQQLTTLLVLLETSGLLNFLISGERGPYIVLAPSEAAFSRLSRKELRQLSRGSDLAYHLIPLRGRPAPEVMNDSTFDTLLGHELRFNVYGGSVYVNGAAVSRGDVPFAHGTIQVVESVLEVPLGDVQAVLVGSGHTYSRVNTLLSVTDLLHSDPGTYTLLAAPDSAITSKGYSWPGLLMNRALGRDLLARHTIKGAWYTEGLLQQRTLTTLAGTTVTFRKDQDGIVSANGVPLRSYNLTATDGVVHLAADLIPESDLGTDPTTIPNPLLTQTESPIYQSFTFGGDEVPTISGLYDTPDRDPYLDFISSPSTGSVSGKYSGTPDQTKTGSELQLPPVPSFEEYMERFRLASVPPTENNIYTRRTHDIQQVTSSTDLTLDLSSVKTPGPSLLKPYVADLQQSPDSQTSESSNPVVHTDEDQTRDHTPPSAAGGSSHGTRTTGDSSSTSPSPATGNTHPSVSREGTDVFLANAVFNDGVRTHSATGQPQPQLPHEHRHQCPDAGAARPATERGTTVDTQGFVTGGQETLPGTPFDSSRNVNDPHALPGGQKVSSGVSGSQAPSVPVVPEGVVVFPRPGVVTDEERAQLDVLALLQRLNLTRFLELVDRTGLTLTVNLDGPWTVFAPSNEAISAIPADALQEIVANTRFLRRLVSYHLAPGRFTSSASFTPGVQLPTLHAGHTLVLDYYTDGPVARWVAGGSVITDLDEEATNGVVHVVDRVLYAPYGDLPTTLALSPALTSFTKLLTQDTALLRYLSAVGPFTLFVPSNHALTNLTLPQHQHSRREWVLSHLVEGRWYTAGFSDTWPLLTLSNATLATVLTGQDKVSVNGIDISYADITATNGVIHVLESPLFTPT